MVDRYFPGALTIKHLEKKVNKTLKKINIVPSNTILGVSTCADELERRIETHFAKHWHEGFVLSGLAGFPFTNSTGMSAYSSHAPENGNLFIIYCPHIGISKDNILGVVE